MQSQDTPFSQADKATSDSSSTTCEQPIPQAEAIQLAVEAILKGNPGQVEELADVFGYLLYDLEAEASNAVNVIAQLDEFMREIFKRSEAFQAALKLYKLQHTGQIRGASKAVDLINEAIEQTQQEHSASSEETTEDEETEESEHGQATS